MIPSEYTRKEAFVLVCRCKLLRRFISTMWIPEIQKQAAFKAGFHVYVQRHRRLASMHIHMYIQYDSSVLLPSACADKY